MVVVVVPIVVVVVNDVICDLCPVQVRSTEEFNYCISSLLVSSIFAQDYR